MTSTRRRGLNTAVTRFWSFAAPVYDQQLLQRWVYRPAQDEVVDQLRTRGSQRVADVACGTGILAGRIQQELQPDEVYGVDMSEGMLAQAKARAPGVQWLTGPAEQLPFADSALDAVVTTSAFHFFDQRAALDEFNRVLAPGGMVAVTVISPAYLRPLDKLTVNVSNPAHTPSPPAMREMFEAAGFAISDQHRVRRPAWTRPVADVITVGIKP